VSSGDAVVEMSRCEDNVAVSIVVVGGDVIMSAEDVVVFVTATQYSTHFHAWKYYQTIFIVKKKGVGYDAFTEMFFFENLRFQHCTSP